MKHITYCCENMKVFIEDPRIKMGYNQTHRMYYLEITSTGTIYLIDYCPACGTMLPENLVDKWTNILKKEFNIDDPYAKEQSKLIPEEFKTDEWWKKRNL